MLVLGEPSTGASNNLAGATESHYTNGQGVGTFFWVEPIGYGPRRAEPRQPFCRPSLRRTDSALRLRPKRWQASCERLRSQLRSSCGNTELTLTG